MKKNRRIQAVLMAGTLAISGTLAAVPALPALADVTYATGSITIHAGAANSDKKTNSGAVYHGYQIFKANVKDDSSSSTGKSAVNITWANEKVKEAVEGVIRADAGKNTDGEENYTGTTAQDALEYLNQRFTADKTSDLTDALKKGSGTRADVSSFAAKLAKAVAALTKTQDVTAETKTQMPEGGEGYWVFVTDASSTDGKTDHSGTAPIFTAIGGSDVEVTEKTSIPVVDKQVKNDAKGASLGHDAADSQMEQEIDYELTGTVADNIGTFDTYKYTFTDTLPEAMTPDTTKGENATLHVYAVHGSGDKAVKTELKRIASDDSTTDPKTGYTVSYNNETNELVIAFADLKSVKAEDESETPQIDSEVKIVVDYQAKLDASKADKLVLGGTGNKNTVKITYSNNPFSTGTGESTPKTTTDYSYKLLLHKIDRTTETNLKGAKFTIQATGADEGIGEEEKAKFVQKDGSLGTESYEFETDEKGEISVSGLDAGSYTVHETASPEGYDTTSDFTFEIKPTYKDQALTSLENVLTSTDSVIAGDTDGNTKDTVMTSDSEKKNAADANTGTVKVTVGDSKRIEFPLTGQAGIASGVAAGGFLVLISAVAMTKNRKKKEE